MSSFQVDDYVTSSSRFLNAAPGKGTDAVTKGKDRVADYSRKVGNFCHKHHVRVRFTCPKQIVYVQTVYTMPGSTYQTRTPPQKAYESDRYV